MSEDESNRKAREVSSWRARHFGFTLQESYQLDQRCRMLCEGHAEVLHKTDEWRTAKNKIPKSFVATKAGMIWVKLPPPTLPHHPYGGEPPVPI